MVVFPVPGGVRRCVAECEHLVYVERGGVLLLRGDARANAFFLALAVNIRSLRARVSFDRCDARPLVRGNYAALIGQFAVLSYRGQIPPDGTHGVSRASPSCAGRLTIVEPVAKENHRRGFHALPGARVAKKLIWRAPNPGGGQEAGERRQIIVLRLLCPLGLFTMVVVEDISANVGLRSLAEASKRIVIKDNITSILLAGGERTLLVIRYFHISALTFMLSTK